MIAPKKRLPEAITVPTGKIAIITARFHNEIADALCAGAMEALSQHGLEEQDWAHYSVPGAFELPLACQAAVNNPEISGVIALGAVIRGESSHFDYVCQACTEGLLNIQLQSQKPVMFGVLTTESMAQATARAGGEKGNKGYDVGIALLEMFATLEQLGKTYA